MCMTKDSDKPAMLPQKGEPPGMERDSHGRPIPLKERLPEDRAKARRARKRKKAHRA
jgi:hypothetical protein